MKGEVLTSFAAGIIHHLAEMTAFLNPTAESYKRLEYYNGGVLIHEGKGKGRVEVTSPDSGINPYLAYSLLVCAGMKGVREHQSIGDYQVILPKTLNEALSLAEKSTFVKDVLTETFLEAYLVSVLEK